jgi:hypothetical protein
MHTCRGRPEVGADLTCAAARRRLGAALGRLGAAKAPQQAQLRDLLLLPCGDEQLLRRGVGVPVVGWGEG